ncbi:MAG TPA: hypothetical protein VGG72_34240 [Bryobacteraceae bacterium]|jgi:hypothetical protein
MAAAPIHLDAEQVSLTGSQLDCGVQNELWEAPSPLVQERSISRILAAGQALHFDDDVVVAEPGYHQPYVQIRGDFVVGLADGPNIKDDGPDGKLVDGKLLVTIPHMCFSDALPILGVRRGKFTQDVNPVLQFSLLNDGWHFMKLVH